MDNRKWEYIDLEDFEFQIRQEEREKEYERRCKERRNRAIRIKNKRKAFIKTIPIRLVGLFLIVLTLKILKIETDGTFALITIPFGLLTVFCPLSAVDI